MCLELITAVFVSVFFFLFILFLNLNSLHPGEKSSFDVTVDLLGLFYIIFFPQKAFHLCKRQKNKSNCFSLILEASHINLGFQISILIFPNKLFYTKPCRNKTLPLKTPS